MGLTLGLLFGMMLIVGQVCVNKVWGRVDGTDTGAAVRDDAHRRPGVCELSVCRGRVVEGVRRE